MIPPDGIDLLENILQVRQVRLKLKKFFGDVRRLRLKCRKAVDSVRMKFCLGQFQKG